MNHTLILAWLAWQFWDFLGTSNPKAWGSGNTKLPSTPGRDADSLVAAFYSFPGEAISISKVTF